LTGRTVPAWLNRAASIGIALPTCVLPLEWLAAPDAETAEGELVDDDAFDEETAMLESRDNRHHDDGDGDYDDHDEYDNSNDGGSLDDMESFITVRDSTGRPVPGSERAPVPR